MSTRYGWLIALMVVALLVVACGPEMATPTPRTESTEAAASPTKAPATAPVGKTAPPDPEDEPANPTQVPVAGDDWRALGSPDAPVTIVDYSDFQ